jgi:hypothetical protein
MPVIQGGKRPLITARHSPQQHRVIALSGLRPHDRTRSGAPMLTLSQKQTHPVPIMQNKIQPGHRPTMT